MRDLTEKEAVDLTIELWSFLKETGKEKEDWDRWEEFGVKFSGDVDEREDEIDGEVWCTCFLCEFKKQQDTDCDVCPYPKMFGDFCFYPEQAPYMKWYDAEVGRWKKYWAGKFLAQMLKVKGGIDNATSKSKGN